MALLPVSEALARILEGAEPLGGEPVDIRKAAGRILAQPVIARRTQSPFDASAMDGYAVRASDVSAAGSRLSVIGESAAGRRFTGTVGPGQAVRIFTGAPVPNVADAVLLQEDADRTGDREIIAREAVSVGKHIRRAGLDFRQGDEVLPAGRLLDPAALSLAAAANHATPSVVRRPVVGIVATGDELVLPGKEPAPDQIVASNSFGLAALIHSAGGMVRDFGIVPDNRDKLATVFNAALSECEVLVTLGGASVGDHDLVRGVLEALGLDLGFWKIAMRPGKPLMFGTLHGRRIVGLPGNPVSSLVCAHLFVLPLVAALAGRKHRADLHTAVLGVDMAQNDQRQDYVRASVQRIGNRLIAAPIGPQDSSMLRTLARADGLIVRPPFASAAPMGSRVQVLMLR